MKIQKNNSSHLEFKDSNETKSNNCTNEAERYDRIRPNISLNKSTNLKDFELEQVISKKETKKKSKKLPNKNEKELEKDIIRYIKHLKQTLKEKSPHLKDFPPLCQCNMNQLTLWENDWNTCANNCLFYKNPKGKILNS